MEFKDGHKKVAGRKKGSKNRNTEVANKIIDVALKKGDEDFEEIWKELKAKDKIDAILKFLPFKKPQMARIESQNKTQPNITINMIAATKDNVKQIDNTIDITHEEVDDE